MDVVIELGRRHRKRQALHQSLLDTATILFREQGVNRTTVEDIARACDVARQTVFNHFPYKETIALELVSEALPPIAHEAQAMLEAGVPALEVLTAVSRSLIEVSAGQGELATVVARELLHPDPERAARAAQLIPLRHIVQAILAQAREEGSLRMDLPLDVVAERFTDVLAQIVAQVMTQEADSLHVHLTVCLDMLLNGITERSTS